MEIVTLLIALTALVLGVLALAGSRALARLAGRGIGPPPAVVFDELSLIAARVMLPFQNEEGKYERPDLILSGGTPATPIPPSRPCPSTYVIYSSWAEHVAACQGFNGPNDGNNRIVNRARQNAQAVAARIRCDDECTKDVEEIWKGWSCVAGPEIVATAAVELRLSCVPEA